MSLLEAVDTFGRYESGLELPVMAALRSMELL